MLSGRSLGVGGIVQCLPVSHTPKIPQDAAGFTGVACA